MKTKQQIERVDLFGDTRKVAFDNERKQFQGVGRISPTDVSRLLEKISEHYGTAKSKRGKRIAEISAELAMLIKNDGSFYADTYSFIANGLTILLEPEQKIIQMKTEY